MFGFGSVIISSHNSKHVLSASPGPESLVLGGFVSLLADSMLFLLFEKESLSPVLAVQYIRPPSRTKD